MLTDNVIFVITTGRSGTKYLTGLFETIDNVSAWHEPDREINILRQINRDNDVELARNFVETQKIKLIEKRIKNNIYIETSHLICKGFLEHLINIFPNIKIIYLSRNLKDTAKSLYKHKSITKEILNKTKYNFYYLLPTDTSCRFKLTKNEIADLSDFELCVWYCFEIFTIYQELKYKNDCVYNVNLKDLNSFDNTIKFFNTLGLTVSNTQLLQHKINKPVHRGKDDSFLDITDDEMNESIYKITNLYYKNYDYIR